MRYHPNERGENPKLTMRIALDTLPQPLPKWYRWTDDITKGVYVRADVVVPEQR